MLVTDVSPIKMSLISYGRADYQHDATYNIKEASQNDTARINSSGPHVLDAYLTSKH